METPLPGPQVEPHLIKARQMRSEFLHDGVRAIKDKIVARWTAGFGTAGLYTAGLGRPDLGEDGPTVPRI